MKKKLLLLVVTILAISLVGVTQASGIDSSKSEQVSGLQGRILGVIEIPKSEIPEEFLEGERAKMAEGGWVIADTGLRREGGLPSVAVKVGKYATVTDENGYYELEGIPAGSHRLQVVLDDRKEVLVDRTVIITAGRSRSKDIYAYYRTIDEVVHGNQRGSQSNVPCLDYNGPYGDCVNYSSGWRRYQNFILSDCDRAYFADGCWRDSTNNRHCNGSHNCSHAIGHSSGHHCH
jgi:hypothetical protein